MKNKENKFAAKQEFTWRVQSHKSTPLGVKAVIAVDQKGKTIFKDEVQLWLASSRSGFVRKLLKALNCRPKGKGKSKIKELGEAISTWMIELESQLIASAHDQPTGDANGNKKHEAEFLKGITLGQLHGALGE